MSDDVGTLRIDDVDFNQLDRQRVALQRLVDDVRPCLHDNFREEFDNELNEIEGILCMLDH